MKVPLLKGDRSSADVQYRSRLPTNAYAVLNPVFDVPGFMAAHPGYTEFADAVVGADRGGNWNERLEQHLRVSGDQLIRVDQNGDIVQLGFIDGDLTNFSHASLPYSFNTQLIVAGLKAYLYDGTTLTQITDPDLGLPIDACWVDGYYFYTDGETLFHSDLQDESAIDPLKFATSEFSPDPTKGVAKTPDNQVIVFNRYTTEFFFNKATEQFAFTRSQGKAVKSGIIGTHLKIEMDGRFYCLGSAKDEAPTFLIIGAGQAQNFSNREIDILLTQYTEAELSRGVMTTRSGDKEKLIYVELPNHTLLYNQTLGASEGNDVAWSILKYGVDYKDAPWRYINGIYDPRINQWIGGDRVAPQLNALDVLTAAQSGNEAEIILHTPFLYLEGSSVDEIEIETLPGHSAEVVRAFISVTYDGVTYGKEWSLAYSKSRGDRTTRFIARRLGYCRDWMGFKIRLVTQSKVAFCNMVVKHG